MLYINYNSLIITKRPWVDLVSTPYFVDLCNGINLTRTFLLDINSLKNVRIRFASRKM